MDRSTTPPPPVSPHTYTHHYLRLAAVSLTVVVRSNHLKLKIRPPHVAIHDGRFDHAAVRFDDEAVFAVLGVFPGGRGDDEPVRHRAVVASVFVQSLDNRKRYNGTMARPFRSSRVFGRTEAECTLKPMSHDPFEVG